VTVPVPVTVIRADPVGEVNAASVRVPGERCPRSDGAALPDALPSANAPIRTAAAPAPAASARTLGVNVTGMATPGRPEGYLPM
jgi:hypothetical protein